MAENFEKIGVSFFGGVGEGFFVCFVCVVLEKLVFRLENASV